MKPHENRFTKNWKEIILSIKGPLSFFALVILCFQAIIVALVYRTEGNVLTIIALLSAIVVILPVAAVSWTMLRTDKAELAAPVASGQELLINLRKVRLFFTTPMSTYKTPEAYKHANEETMGIVKSVRAFEFIDKVYYFNEKFSTLDEFEHADLSVPGYFNEIEQCDYFILVAEDRRFSSIHFEAGYALAKEKRCIYFVKNPDCVTFLMRLAAYAYPHRIRLYEYSSPREIVKVLHNKETYI